MEEDIDVVLGCDAISLLDRGDRIFWVQKAGWVFFFFFFFFFCLHYVVCRVRLFGCVDAGVWGRLKKVV